jgi:thiamine-phosphate pyrophosphorylase
MGAGNPLDLSVYLVTDTPLCGRTGVAATAREAAQSGASVVQLRDHYLSDDEFVALGREVVAALAGFGVPVLVDDRVHLVAAIGAAGAHVGQDDLDVVQARRLLGPRAILGLSVHSLEQLAAAAYPPEGTIDYLGVGPVWPQTTKRDAADPISIDTLKLIAARSPWPVVGIGGITKERVGAVREAGAAGVAVVSAICGRPDVRAATTSIRSAWAGAAKTGGAL